MVKRIAFLGSITALSILAAALVFCQSTSNIPVTQGQGPVAPSTCVAPALFFTTPAGTPMFCSSGVFVSFGSSTGAAITGSPVAGNLTVFSAANSITNGNLSGDCTTAGGSTITCTKTSGTVFATSATTDTTNASNITSGNLPIARLPVGAASPVSGGILGATGASTLAWSAALGANLPVIGGGAGATPTTGTKAGTTNNFQMTSGSITAGNVPKVDANGNLIDSNTLPGTSATGVPVNVVNDSPSVPTKPGGTVTLNLGSATIPTQNQFASTAVGALFQYNSGTSPIFRTPILTVGTNQITVASPWPGTNATVANADGTTTGNPASGNWNMVNDACAQMNASLLNHPGINLDNGISGSNLPCLVNPMAGVSQRPGAGLRLHGAAQFKAGREWTPPGYFNFIGAGRSNFEGGTNTGTDIFVDSTNFPNQNSESVTNASTVTVAAASTTFTDMGAGVTASQPPFQTGIASAACDGTQYGHLTLTAAGNGTTLGGLVEGQNIVLAGFTGIATTWNGSNLMTGISGPNIEIQFASNNCAAPAGLFGSATANTARSDFLYGSYASTANTGFLLSTTNTPCYNGTVNSGLETNPPFNQACQLVQDSVAEFLPTDANSCTLTATGGVGTLNTPYTIAEFIDSTHVTIQPSGGGGSNPGWTIVGSTTFNKTCYFLSTVKSITDATHLVTTLPLQSTSIGNVSYNIAPPLMAWQNFGNGAGQTFAVYANQLANFTLNCAAIADCTGFQNLTGQEESRMDNITITDYTAVGLETESGHQGPITNLNIGFGGVANKSPLTTCIAIWTAPGSVVTRSIDSFTCTIGGAIVPWASVDVEGNRATIRNGHHEGYVNAYVFCKYQGQQCKGDILDGPEPGIQGYNDILIPNTSNANGATVGLTVTGGFNNNNVANAWVDDNLDAPHCGPGRTVTFAPNSELPFFVVGNFAPNSSGYRYRYSSTPNLDSCLGAANSSGGSSTLNAQYFKASSQVMQVSGANVTCGTGGTLAPCTSLTTIPGLTWTSPALSAQNWSFDCKINYSQATANAANQFGIQWATTAPTNWNATGELQLTAATTSVPGTPVVTQNVTTATSLVTGTPTSAVNTVYQAHLWGTAELPSVATASAPVLNIMVLTGAAADLLTVYRGSACTVW